MTQNLENRREKMQESFDTLNIDFEEISNRDNQYSYGN